MRIQIILLALLLQFAFVTPAFAHARMIKSVPAKDAVLTQSPGTIELWFNELLDDNFNTIEVYPSSELGKTNHANLAKSKPKVDEKDRRHLLVEVKSLKPGEYVIEWRVLSRDGHSAPGRLTFKVKPN
jgi:copper resistance protein C